MVFLEKRQVAKSNLVKKSFLTVILCYRIDAPLLNQDLHGPGRLVAQGSTIASEVPASKREAPWSTRSGASRDDSANAGSCQSWFNSGSPRPLLGQDWQRLISALAGTPPSSSFTIGPDMR